VFKYFKLVFFQLRLVKISFKFIVMRLNYGRKKKAPFYLKTPCKLDKDDRVFEMQT